MAAFIFKRGAFPSADEDAFAAELKPQTSQTQSDSYILAYQDNEFLCRPELRPVRLQLEMLKPELIMQENNIDATIVVFGSARIPEPDHARAQLFAAETDLERDPANPKLQALRAKAALNVKNSRYYDEARKLGRIISTSCQMHCEQNLVVITGGGPGIMEAANRGAHDTQAQTVGLNIVLPFEQAPNPYITPELCFNFHYFAIRKMHLLMRARGLVCFPGGYGTMDELFETLTLVQTGKVEPIPILLFGEEFWRSVINFESLVSHGFIAPQDIKLFRFVETAEEAWKYLADGIIHNRRNGNGNGKSNGHK